MQPCVLIRPIMGFGCCFDAENFDPVDMVEDGVEDSTSSDSESEHAADMEIPDHLIRSLAMGLRPRRPLVDH